MRKKQSKEVNNKVMSKKTARLEMVKMIISSQEVGTQDELMVALSQSGIKCTQATLSRDLKEMRVVKMVGSNGRKVYMLPHGHVFRGVSDTHATVSALHHSGVLSVKFSGHMAVVKTLPGHASHVAYDLDNAQLDIVLGTVAGDDTVFVALDEDVDRDFALRCLAGAANLQGV